MMAVTAATRRSRQRMSLGARASKVIPATFETVDVAAFVVGGMVAAGVASVFVSGVTVLICAVTLGGLTARQLVNARFDGLWVHQWLWVRARHTADGGFPIRTINFADNPDDPFRALPVDAQIVAVSARHCCYVNPAEEGHRGSVAVFVGLRRLDKIEVGTGIVESGTVEVR